MRLYSLSKAVLAFSFLRFAWSAPSHNRHAEEAGGVACQSAVCSEIGGELLRAGGNAADAIVGTVFCVGVVAPHHSGIGGGGFMLIRSPKGIFEAVDFRDVAPAAAYQDMYNDNVNGSIQGGLASAVPGEVRGLYYLHENYGILPWADVIQPAINLARDGFSVTSDLERYMNLATMGGDFLVEDPVWAEQFAPGGVRVQQNDILKRPCYASTLEEIATKGPDAFYEGRIAEATIRALQEQGGIMTLEDLANYRLIIREPVQTSYRGYTLTSVGAPAGGIVTLSILKTIEGYEGFDDPINVNLSTHRLVEAMRFGFAARSKLGDPSMNKGLDDFQWHLLSPEAAEKRRLTIQDDRTLAREEYDNQGFEVLDTPGTSQMSAADSSGLAISLTTTINLLFGSKLMVNDTGVIMNNGMNDFSLPNTPNFFGLAPSPSNFIRPFARPQSSMSPVIATLPCKDPSKPSILAFVLGASGGSRIITSVVQAAQKMLPRSYTVSRPRMPYEPLSSILAAPRVHDQLSPNTTLVETTYDNSTVAGLRERGHNVTYAPLGLSAVQAVRLSNREIGIPQWEAVGEPRQKDSGGVIV